MITNVLLCVLGAFLYILSRMLVVRTLTWLRKMRRPINVLTGGVVLPEISDQRWREAGGHFRLGDISIIREWRAYVGHDHWLVCCNNKIVDGLFYDETDKYGNALFERFDEERKARIMNDIQNTLENT